jgi:hypothetical protein
VAPLESHNILKHITDVMTLFCIHCFSHVVRLIGTREYCMQIKTILLKVCVYLRFVILYVYLFFELVPKHYLMLQLMEISMLARTKLRYKETKVSFW